MLSAVLVFPQPITLFQIQFLNAIGDLLDLIPSLSPTKNSSLKFFKRWDMGHCSALIKVSSLSHCPSSGPRRFFLYVTQTWHFITPAIVAYHLMGSSVMEVKNWKELIEGTGCT